MLVLETPESRYRAGLVSALSRLTPDALAVNQAVEALRVLDEGTVRRSFGALHREMSVKLKALNAKFEARFRAVKLKLKMMTWVLSMDFVMQLATFSLVGSMMLSEDRSRTPPPPSPSPTLQAPA